MGRAELDPDLRLVAGPGDAASVAVPHWPHHRGSHALQLYEDGAFLERALRRFVQDTLGAGDGAVVVATAARLAAVDAALRDAGVEPGALVASGRYVTADADEALDSILLDGWPDEARFAAVLAPLLAAAGRGRRGVRVFGELVALLASSGRHEAALRLEQLWGAQLQSGTFSLVCAYPLAAFGRESDAPSFEAVCDAHARAFPAETWSPDRSAWGQAREVARLQQRARALESEVAERRRAEQARDALARELERRLGQLAEADRRKDEFLATLAHELRNPLAPIRLAMKLLRARVPGDGARYLDIVDRQAETLTRLVDDLLDVSRVTQGKVAIRPELLDVAPIVARALDATRHLLEQRRHTLGVTLPAGPLRVRADAVRLEQVLVNVLTNAAKYTPPGGHVGLDVARTAAGVELRVKDDGVGIAPELLGRVFDLFQQAERSIDRAQGGLGIGLTVARRLVELHGGTIEVRSDGPDLGTEVVVRLPLAPEEDAPADPAPRAARAEVSLRVLVVDDNEDAGEVLALALRDAGHDVLVARDGAEALRLDRAHAPQLVLLDLGMPGMDGYELARRLRAAGTAAQLVAVTGYGQASDRARTAAAGFTGHLVKPVQLDALQRVLDEAHGLTLASR